MVNVSERDGQHRLDGSPRRDDERRIATLDTIQSPKPMIQVLDGDLPQFVARLKEF
jgi:hypothetical protein